MIRRVACLLSAAVFFMSSCSAGQTDEPPRATATFDPTGLLTPYFTQTTKPTSPTPTLSVQLPVTPAPTATPFLHTLTDEDTLLGLAFRYGVSLEELEAANPGVDAHYLTVGKQIVIPISGSITETLPAATPVPVQIKQTRCYPAGDGGAWCVVAIYNDTQDSLENLSAGIGVYTPQGEIIASRTAYAPLNILRPGSLMPLMTYFSPPFPEDYEAHSQVVSGLAIPGDDERYLDLPLKIESIVISRDGNQATVSGEVILPPDTDRFSELWLLAVAYDGLGNINGIREWRSESETHFEIEVFSLGGRIEHVEVLEEARR